MYHCKKVIPELEDNARLEQFRKEFEKRRPLFMDAAKEMVFLTTEESPIVNLTEAMKAELRMFGVTECYPTKRLFAELESNFNRETSFSIREPITFELKGEFPHPTKYDGVVIPYGTLTNAMDTIKGIINNLGTHQ